MKRLIVALVQVWIGVSLTACTQIWLPDERSGLGAIDSRLRIGSLGKTVETTIALPLDPAHVRKGFFDLYYFVRMPTTGKASKTILFCPGGPGQFVPGPTIINAFADFLVNSGYNVVHYHPRGAGFSQISAQNKNDRFLKTSYVVQDIEAIRKHFLGPDVKWDAVIGYSFGTVVAQYYAGAYKRNLDRLILFGTQSRHAFQNSPSPFDQITSDILDLYRMTLGNIFQRTEFSDPQSDDYLIDEDKNKIIDKAFGINGIFKRTEEKFGSVPFVISAYCELKDKSELANNNLSYSKQFFFALRALRDVGWSPPTARQVELAKNIKDEIQGTGPSIDDCGPDLTGSSERVFYVVSFFDGMSMRFLNKWLGNGKTRVRDAVRAAGGEVHYTQGDINRFVDKVGISDTEIIEAWDPERHKHDVPTMILKGTADAVPAGGATEHIFLNALAGPRTLIVYPGVGHGYLLPVIPSSAPPSNLPNPTVCVPNQPVRDCLIYSFLVINPTDFKDPAVNTLLPVLAEHCAKVSYRDQSTSIILPVAATCS